MGDIFSTVMFYEISHCSLFHSIWLELSTYDNDDDDESNDDDDDGDDDFNEDSRQ